MAGVGTTNPTNQTGLPIDQLINTGATTPAPQTGTASPMGQTQFLQLLMTEMSNQDPLNPMDSTQSVTQLAQFQALLVPNQPDPIFPELPVKLCRHSSSHSHRPHGDR